MRIFRDAWQVARLESRLLQAFPKLRFSLLGIVLIPALYAFIYLESVWDPASQTGHLPAAIVNLDRGTQANGTPVNLGADLVASLKAGKQFGFYDAPDAEAAHAAVRTGGTLFALVIPADFSASALGAQAPGAGRLVVYASEGNNYAGAGFAKRFADELGHRLNASLSEKRWTVVLGAAASASGSLEQLHQGVDKLRNGAAQLQAGVGKAEHGAGQLAAGGRDLSQGVGQLTEGMRQLGAGIRTLDARKPAAEDLNRLKAGAAQLADGHGQLEKAFPQMEDGARKLADGAHQLQEQSRGIPIAGTKVAAAAGQLGDGAGQLRGALATAGQGETRLAAGSRELAKSVGQLSDGFAAYAGGVSMIAAKLPPDSSLEQLAAGARTLQAGQGELHQGLVQLAAGSQQLRAGLDTLAAALPASAPAMAGTPGGLATSVQPQLVIDAPVQTNGLGLAPNFIPVSLWLGAVMTAFIFHLRRLPEEAAGRGRASLLLGKLGLLWTVNLAQAALVLAMTWGLLGLQPANGLGLALTMAVSSCTFMLLILTLVRLFGDAGKAVALILLVLQLSAAGGVLPVELTNDFYRAVSPFLPFTWSIKAVRASAFGALGGDWGAALGVLAATGAALFIAAMVVGRWKFVPPAEHRPAMDL